MIKNTLLYGDQKDSGSAAQFIATLLDAVTRIHKVHFMTTGPGSFAAHEALGSTYEELQDGADKLAECYMGTNHDGLMFSEVNSGDWKAEVSNICEYISANRMLMGADSHIQNIIDEILGDLSRNEFRLERLA